MSEEQLFLFEGKKYAVTQIPDDVKVLINDVITTEKELEKVATTSRAMQKGIESMIERIRKLLPDPLDEQPTAVTEPQPSDMKVEVSDATVMDDNLEH